MNPLEFEAALLATEEIREFLLANQTPDAEYVVIRPGRVWQMFDLIDYLMKGRA